MTRVLFSRTFWLDAIERALKSAAQGAMLAAGQDVISVDLFSADWRNVAGMAAGMAALSILTSVASAGSPGVSPASLLPPGA